MFKEIYDKYPWEMVKEKIYSSTDSDLLQSLRTENKSTEDLFPLFSPAADSHLEEFALISSQVTRLRFGNTIQLYTPLYISNECLNTCLYCGFNKNNNIRRTTLNSEQIEQEAEVIYNRGFRHILLLTGDHREAVPVELLADIGNKIHKKFASVSIEVYPMEENEYKKMADSGIDGLTLYQETYNKETYSDVHPSGKKSDFYWRLQGPDRGGKAGIRKIGIGSLLGLSDWRVDGFYAAMHARYLTKKYWRSHIQISFPRLRDSLSDFSSPFTVDDNSLTHLICIMRIILPDSGLVMSTREPEYIRDNLLPLGITVMSAGSCTEPGGYSGIDVADNQFNIEDTRTPDEIAEIIKQKGFEPVWKDWEKNFA